MRFLRLLGTATCLVLAASPSAAQLCESIPPNFFDYDPQTSTEVINGAEFYGVFLFMSPENTDPEFVYHVGQPNGDGCIGGIRPGSTEPTGILDLEYIQAYCLGFEIESALPPQVELFDWDGALLETFTPATSSVQIFTYERRIARIRVTPGSQGGVRAALCIDDVAVIHPPLPTRRASWGTLKAFYR